MSEPISGKITLTDQEITWAIKVGTARHKGALARGYKDKHGFEGDPLAIHIDGCCGEIACSKCLGYDWLASVDTFKRKADIGDRGQIRTRSKFSYDLLIRPDDKIDDVYILVIGSLPDKFFWVFGWVEGKDARNEQWSKTHGNRPEAWFVPKCWLKPMWMRPSIWRG